MAAATNSNAETSSEDDPLSVLHPREFFWRDHQQWLESCGYMLPMRYKPDWTPSWKATTKPFLRCDDGRAPLRTGLLDATRMSDGKVVMLKKISKKVHPYEAEIGQMFSSPELAMDPRNHCVPFYDVLQVPDEQDTLLLVQPLLRMYNDPSLDTVGETIEFLHQIFEGLQFMHLHHVAHRDCMSVNIMLDPTAMYPKSYHPRAEFLNLDLMTVAKHHTRTERPSKYYIIDFGLSVKFDAEDANPAAIPILGGDKSVPEYQERAGLFEAHNPFPVDVYYLGNAVRQDFLQTYEGLDFLDALVAEMVQDDPTKRPTMDEVVARFEAIRAKLTSWKLRARLVARREDGLVRFLKGVRHVYRTARFIVCRYPAIPTPASAAQS